MPPRTRACERGVESSAPAQHAVDELLRPAPVARVERRRAPLEGGVEQHALAQVGQHVGRGDARVGDAGVGDWATTHA